MDTIITNYHTKFPPSSSKRLNVIQFSLIWEFLDGLGGKISILELFAEHIMVNHHTKFELFSSGF